MKEEGIRARFARGGSNKYLVAMLEEGLVGTILDGQTFDLDGVRSMRTDPRHQDTSPFTSYNFHGKGNFASMVDVAVLGATEVERGFVLIAPAIRRHIRCDTSRIDGAVRAEARRDRTAGVSCRPARMVLTPPALMRPSAGDTTALAAMGRAPSRKDRVKKALKLG